MSPQQRDEDPDDREETLEGGAASAPDGEGPAAPRGAGGDADDPAVGAAGGAADRAADGAADDAAAWEQIVANYGEAPSWQDPPARARPHPDHPAGSRGTPASAGTPGGPAGQERYDEGGEAGGDLQRGPHERFRPPPPPPLPLASPPRLVAWFGVFGVPAVVLVALVAGFELPSLAGIVLMFWFVGGFAYLVASMGPRREDPDDGAVL